MSRDTDGNYTLFPSDAAVEAVANGHITRVIIPNAGPKPDGTLFARFFGKIAVEAMAAKLLKNAPYMLDEFAHDDQVDHLRNYARYGKQGLAWPYSERRIYPADCSFPTSDGRSYEVLHEFDFLYTDQGEMYFASRSWGRNMRSTWQALITRDIRNGSQNTMGLLRST